jgi:sushi, von Willebrand factor type A, EGF and pentraxin domain-containing protein 1
LVSSFDQNHWCAVAELNSTFDLAFASSGITNYADLDGAVRRESLAALTAAMWIKTDDRENQGTPLSYATASQFNAFTLTDYSGFVLYISGKGYVTDVAINDGYWHHVTITFQGDERGDMGGGMWKIYVDGELRANGTTESGTRVEGQSIE